MKKVSFLKKNGLSLALAGLFLVFWGGQSVTGWYVYNKELKGDLIPNMVQLKEQFALTAMGFISYLIPNMVQLKGVHVGVR
ncbi:DUF6766 family protein [Emticicia sp. 17c]|uniref:DUF6766 family protein n=1 Tax=Emticicia sp. 17c TaxID=3127704 RepID=UPI00301D2BCA